MGKQTALATRMEGSGPLMIWGHALMANMAVDDAAALLDFRLLAKELKLLRYDARGHGQSPGSTEAQDYHWSQLAADMLALADQHSPEEAVILGGASMGCATALQAALQSPQRVKALILVLPPTGGAQRVAQRKKYKTIATAQRWLGNWPYKLVAKLPLPAPPAHERLRRMSMASIRGLANADLKKMNAALAGASLSDLPEQTVLQTLNIPCAILSWQGDDSHPPESAAYLAAHLPDVRLYRVDSMDAIDDWTFDLLEFLDGVQRESQAA